MPIYRLTYPATIYASVEAPTYERAAQQLVDALDAVQNGIIIQLDGVDNEVLYPDSDATGAVTTIKVGLDNEEPSAGHLPPPHTP
jgi:hypothetical protein